MSALYSIQSVIKAYHWCSFHTHEYYKYVFIVGLVFTTPLNGEIYWVYMLPAESSYQSEEYEVKL